MADQTIVPIGGGKVCDGLAEFLVRLTRKERPRLLYIGTASAEDPEQALRTYDRFAGIAEVTRLEFFPWPPEDLRATVLDQDVVFVGGGNTANMLAIWREHGLDEIVRDAWQAGVVLAGVSAGMICWFEGGVTDSFGPQLEAMECLGLIPGSACPHYDGEELRRPRYHELVADGFPGGWAADDGVALHFEGWELREAVTALPGKAAYRVRLGDDGVVEERVDTRAI